MNPYEPQQLIPNAPTSEADSVAASRRFRWTTIPATLSWFFGLFAVVAIPIGILQNIDVYQNASSQMMLFAAVGMPIALLIAGVLNVIAGFRWIGGRWLSALSCNAIAYGTMMIPVAMYESAMDAARRL
jgi:hypothetical protein